MQDTKYKLQCKLSTVSSGSEPNTSIKAWCICLAVPSKNLPHPETNKVSPRKERWFLMFNLNSRKYSRIVCEFMCIFKCCQIAKRRRNNATQQTRNQICIQICLIRITNISTRNTDLHQGNHRQGHRSYGGSGGSCPRCPSGTGAAKCSFRKIDFREANFDT